MAAGVVENGTPRGAARPNLPDLVPGLRLARRAGPLSDYRHRPAGESGRHRFHSLVTSTARPSSSSGTDAGRVDVFCRTDTGRERSHNEDSFLVADLTRASIVEHGAATAMEAGERGLLFMVAD